jgi:hypothetical protein
MKDKEKKYRSHIKVYFLDEKEETIIKAFARKHSMPASTWLRVIALEKIQKEEQFHVCTKV